MSAPQPSTRVTAAAACAVITNERSQVLLVQPSYLGGRWNLPGGVVEDGERPDDALLRELDEEIAVRPSAFHLTGTYHVFPRDALRYVYRCRIDTTPRPDGAEILACEYVDVQQVEARSNPWVLDRVLDALEFDGRPVMRVQVKDALQRHQSARHRPW